MGAKSKAERDREYYAKNRDAILERKRARYAADPEKYREINQMSAMRKRRLKAQAQAVLLIVIYNGELE